jgi:hypothetical protein
MRDEGPTRAAQSKDELVFLAARWRLLMQIYWPCFWHFGVNVRESARVLFYRLCLCVSDLPGELKEEITSSGRGWAGNLAHDDDIVCCVKRRASDKELAQPPVLVLPVAFLGRAVGIPQELSPVNIPPPSYKLGWLDLASALLGLWGPIDSDRSVRYLVALARGDVYHNILPRPLPYHQNPRQQPHAVQVPVHILSAALPAATFRAQLQP